MAKVTVAFVDTDTQQVLDLRQFEDRGIPADPEGHRYLAEGRDWAEGTRRPVIGDLWEGNIPASFIPMPAPAEDEKPANLEEAGERIRAAQELLQKALDDQAELLGQR